MSHPIEGFLRLASLKARLPGCLALTLGGPFKAAFFFLAELLSPDAFPSLRLYQVSGGKPGCFSNQCLQGWRLAHF